MAMKTFSFAMGEGKFCIEATVVATGNDFVVVFGGGEKQHIGAVSVGWAHPSLTQNGTTSSSSSLICLSGHKEDLLARTAALELSRYVGHTVAVTVGIHIDAATVVDIATLESNFHLLLEKIIIWYKEVDFND
jgi:gallate decarboxylase subunit D